jgi:hypothetical protein
LQGTINSKNKKDKTLTHAHERKDNGQFCYWGMMIKKQGQLLNIKKNGQKGRIQTIGLLSHKAPRKWPYARWS